MKKIAVLLISVMVMSLLGGCATKTKEASASKPKQVVAIGLMPDVDSIPFIIAQEKGFFKQEGVTVTLEFFKSAVERDSALQSGKLDGAISDMLAQAFGKNGGFDTVITSLTTGSYKLVVNKNEKAASVKELKGKNVGISRNTIIDYVTDRVAAKGGLEYSEMNTIVIPQIPTRLEMLRNGKIAAATLPEPMASIAIKDGGRVLQSSDQLGINPGVMLFTTKSVKEKEQEIQAVYRAYNKAVDYLSKEPASSYIDLVIEKGGFPLAVKESLVLPHYNKAAVPQSKDIEDVIVWLLEKNLIHKGYTDRELVDDRFVK